MKISASILIIIINKIISNKTLISFIDINETKCFITMQIPIIISIGITWMPNSTISSIMQANTNKINNVFNIEYPPKKA